jgi:hypothetical protein
MTRQRPPQKSLKPTAPGEGLGMNWRGASACDSKPLLLQWCTFGCGMVTAEKCGLVRPIGLVGGEICAYSQVGPPV